MFGTIGDREIMTEEHHEYKLVICPICHLESFKTQDFKHAMIMTSGMFQFLTEKHQMNDEQIGIFECMQRFDPIVNINYDLSQHISKLMESNNNGRL